jgi:hypothetical protein
MREQCSQSAPSLLCNLVPVCSYSAGARETLCWSREVTAYVTTAAPKDYLYHNRIVGGIPLRQEVADESCLWIDTVFRFRVSVPFPRFWAF